MRSIFHETIKWLPIGIFGFIGLVFTAAPIYDSVKLFTEPWMEKMVSYPATAIAIFIPTAVLWYWAFRSSKPIEISGSEKVTKIAGDNYLNSGNNFGHMGPVNIGRQLFEFNQDVGNEILSKIPKHQVKTIQIIGSDRAQAVGRQIVKFLEMNGYDVSNQMIIGVISPPPSSPISFENSTLIIAADV